MASESGEMTNKSIEQVHEWEKAQLVAHLEKYAMDSPYGHRIGLRKDILTAFSEVPRHLFLPGAVGVYADAAVVTHTKRENGMDVYTSSSSGPGIMYLMIYLADIQEGQRVLEVGTGSGYNAGIMSNIVGKNGRVVSVDIQKDTVKHARKILHDKLKLSNVELHALDANKLSKDLGAFDHIIVTVGCSGVPEAWLEALNPGGTVILPLKGVFNPLLLLNKTTSGDLSAKFVGSSDFMDPLGSMADGIAQLPVSDTVVDIREDTLIHKESINLDSMDFWEWLFYQVTMEHRPMKLFTAGTPGFYGYIDSKSAGGISVQQWAKDTYIFAGWGSMDHLEQLKGELKAWREIGSPSLGENERAYKVKVLSGTQKQSGQGEPWIVPLGCISLELRLNK